MARPDFIFYLAVVPAYLLYWRLTRPIDPDEAAQLNKRLCYGMGGDKGKWGLGTVLRAPGTLNYKRGRPTLVAGGVGA